MTSFSDMSGFSPVAFVYLNNKSIHSFREVFNAANTEFDRTFLYVYSSRYVIVLNFMKTKKKKKNSLLFMVKVSLLKLRETSDSLGM